MKLNGKLFLELLQLKNLDITAEDVRDALAKLTAFQLQVLFETCIIKEDEPTLCFTVQEQRDFIPISNSSYRMMSSTEAKKRLRYEQNYLARKELSKYLSPDSYYGGKHSRGCKRKYRRK